MSKMGKRVDAFSLPTVMVVSVIMALTLLAALAFVDLDRQNYALYHRQKQWMLDVQSAAAKYRIDSTLVSPGDSLDVNMFGRSESGVSVSVMRWGLYEIARFYSAHLPYSVSHLVGKKFSCSQEASLYVADHKRPLSFAGATAAEGIVYAPRSGINYTEMKGRAFTGKEVVGDNWLSSDSSLPPIDSSVFSYLDSLSRLRVSSWNHLNIPNHRHSFQAPTELAYCRTNDERLHLHGNIILYAERLIIRRASDLDGILVFAKSVKIEDGFEGRLQLFCSDSIDVGNNVRLRYPSGLFVSNPHGHPCITIGKRSHLQGYVVALAGVEEDPQQKYPCLFQNEGTLIEGLLYVNGHACVSGEVYGATYLKDCFCEESGEKYPSVLYNCHFAASDAVAYPCLLRGPYRRRVVKKVY